MDRMKKAPQESRWTQSSLELLLLVGQCFCPGCFSKDLPLQEQQSLGAGQGLKSPIKGGSHGGAGDSCPGPAVQQGSD